VLTPYLNPSNMPSKVSERAVTEFLRDALALDGLGVSKLNAMARAAGLLGERQRITDAKPFRRAKVLLGIRSVRDGFGPRGGWLWELPPRSDVPPPISTRQERSAPREPVVPREWVQGVARLEQLRPPADIPRHRWHQFVKDCQAFMASQLAKRAAQLEWDAMALFGCRPAYPLAYLGKAGLLWHVDGGKIVEVHRGWAVIDRLVNRSQSIFYRRDVDPEKITLPWRLRPGS
jgi:hypothetical protein